MAKEPPGEGRHRTPPPQRSQQRVDRLRHPSGVAEVLPHEPLHAEQPVSRLQPAGRGEPHLLVAGEFVGRLACREMQVVANPHQKLAGIAEGIGVGP